MIRDDHDVARHGTLHTLSAESDIDVVGDTGSVVDALDILATGRPNVAIVDILRADGDAIAAARLIRAASPFARVLLLVAEAGLQAVAATLLAGASGYVRRNAAATMVGAVRLIADGHRLLDSEDIHAAQLWIDQRLQAGEQLLDPMGDRILELIVSGNTDPDIVARMPISQRRIDHHVAGLLAVLHLPGVAAGPLMYASISGWAGVQGLRRYQVEAETSVNPSER